MQSSVILWTLLTGGLVVFAALALVAVASRLRRTRPDASATPAAHEELADTAQDEVKPPDESLGDEARLLEAHLREQRPWLDAELSLHDLAHSLDSSPQRLSKVINDGLGVGFYALLNNYRLAEFERLVEDPSNRRRAVIELASEAGFSSKATFYRIFREAHGVTPTEYRRAIARRRAAEKSRRGGEPVDSEERRPVRGNLARGPFGATLGSAGLAGSHDSFGSQQLRSRTELPAGAVARRHGPALRYWRG
ncbi:MAG: helix-turn-helix domain-containing protein [Acidobacteria bacterium]|nr:MAG: helix-turn-helix domain-containing protein [Acidobacteriota bacterium]REK04441.1 MAG: helix-turn-helix domain-containing protein [Acidobacteriota bacterium]